MATNTMLSLAPNTQTSQATPFLGTCKRCASPSLFTKAQGPHFGLFCHDCGLWQQWIRKSEAHRYQRDKVRLSAPQPTLAPIYKEVPEQVRPAFDSPHDNSHKSCSERFEQIERELTIVLKAIWACGVLQPKSGAPDIDVDSELVSELADTLAREETRR